MTREQKLALIIGFSLILAVGVLISDHLSRARTDTIIADADIDRPMVVHRLVDVPAGIGEAGLPVAGRDAVLSDPGPGEAFTVREPLPGLPREPGREPIGVASLAHGTLGPADPGVRTMLDDAPEESPVEVRMTSATRPLNLPGFVPVDSYGSPLLDISPGDGSRRPAQAPSARTETPAATPAQTRAQPPVQTPAASVTHIVAEGETLYGIAARYYGSGDLWPELLKANKASADAEGRVFEGAKLVIPQRGGMPIAQTPTQTPAPATTRARQTQPTQQAGASGAYGSYTIKPGDTLSEISQELMGTMRRMNELIELNKDQIRDANDIRVGMKLRYPRGQRA